MLARLIDPSRALSGPMHKLGACAAVALIVPGGSLIAFVWALQQRGWLTARPWRTFFALLALGTGLVFPG